MGSDDMPQYKSFIEVQFPVSKVSKESYKERKAVQSQTLTGLGKWWGRKPLVLVRAALIGILMPVSNDKKKDMDIFLKIMTMDKSGLILRRTKSITAKDIFDLFTLKERERYFENENGKIIQKFNKKLSSEEKDNVIEKAWNRMTYDQKLNFCARPEEVDIVNNSLWQEVNEHLGTNSYSLNDLINELGIKKFNRRPIVGDCFCGGGSIPFESARIGADVFASDLNPIAGLLTWADLNIASATAEEVECVRNFQEKVYKSVNKQMEKWGIETNEKEDRANAYLYCTEAICSECGYKIP